MINNQATKGDEDSKGTEWKVISICVDYDFFDILKPMRHKDLQLLLSYILWFFYLEIKAYPEVGRWLTRQPGWRGFPKTPNEK